MLSGSLTAVLFCILVCLPTLAYSDDEVVGSIDTLIRGNVAPGSTVNESDLGDVTADALRIVSGTDIAIVNGGELRANLQAGPCSWASVQAVFAENKTLAIADITAAQLWEILEHGVSYIVLGEDEKTDAAASSFEGFPQISGLTFQCDLANTAGIRLMSVTLSDGRTLARGDQETHITLCATEYMLSGGYGYESVSYERMEIGLTDALAQYISGGIAQPGASRIRMIGSYDTPLISRVNVLLIGLVCCVLAFCFNRVRGAIKKENEY